VVTFKPVRFNHDGTLPLQVFPFFWTAAALRVKGASPGAVRREVTSWANRWFDLVDTGQVEPVSEPDLHGVIHRLQYRDSECTWDVVAFEVDLGSAHIESLMTLLDATKRAGANEVTLGPRRRRPRGPDPASRPVRIRAEPGDR